MIVGIGDGIKYTAKVIFHLIYNDGSILPEEMCYSLEATESAVSPAGIVFSNQRINSLWKISSFKIEVGKL